MTVEEVFLLAREYAIMLEAHGDTLYVDAPAGILTSELRAELVRLKPALLARLAPAARVVCLKGGLTVPLPAILLALDLEKRGFRMALDAGRKFKIEPRSNLTTEDSAAIRRWWLQLGAIVGYTCEVLA